jgi:GNAT superfamily N-acetyltransferase
VTDQGFLRAQAFERDLHERCANRKYDHRWGTAFFNDEVPMFYELNFLLVEGEHPDISAEGLAEEAERVMSATRCLHRKVVVYDETEGEKLAPDFETMGWDVDRLLFMVYRREPDSWVQLDAAVELNEEAHEAAKDTFNRREPYVTDEETARQLLLGAHIISKAANKRAFGAWSGGVIASICELYSDGSVAQIEDVATLREFRNKGLGRAVVLRALRTALDSSHDEVFLIADAEDWPKDLYKKLGFDTAGTYWHFVKRPPGHPGWKEES